MLQTHNTTGLIIMNLGSPDSTALKDVKKYLAEFLMDERVIDLPEVIRTILVKGIIVPFRTPKSAEAYETIWWKEGAPLKCITNNLKEALLEVLDMPISVAMRYGQPTPEIAYATLLKHNPGIKKVILLPLYPHYAMSSYETAVEAMFAYHKKAGYSFELTTIQPFYKEDLYIKAFSENIKPYLDKGYDHLLFSYHGIPERHLRKSDASKFHCLGVKDCCTVPSPAHATCYRHQCYTTTELTAKYLGLDKSFYSFSFQSRLGRDPWLKPYTDFRLKDMPKEGIKKLLVVCPAFVSDCLETLEEIAIRGKEDFMEAGGEQYEMIPCLNTHPLWIDAIKQWVSALK